ncbi:MAG: hypothetical protein HHJ18_17315 [Polaromonas sp.]|nr:hypothetical protein [Polaromonas sp.]
MNVLRQCLPAVVTLDELQAMCREHRKALVFQHFVHALRVPTRLAGARLILIDGYPPGLVRRYIEQAHFNAE